MLFRKSFVFNFCMPNKRQCRFKYEWIKPTGYDTGIQVYHEITKQKVPLIFPNPYYVKWYMCGPTVYDTSHIGHASCYIRNDIIRRVLKEYYNIDPVVAIGVTDVSEKIFERSKELNKSPRSLAKEYELEFFKQMKELNVLPPTLILRVTDHAPVLIDFIMKLLEIGAAYKTIDGSIYFKTTVHKNYGRFKAPVAEVDKIVVPGKLSPLDFVLLKSSKNEVGKVKSLPGWHIQCSAMASHVFGESLDIHSGGADLIFPHHENEESQSTAYHDCHQWVNYWFHTGLLNMGEEKMSKSLSNYISISEFLQKNSSDHIRMFCMMSPYRNNLEYNTRTFELAAKLCDQVVKFLKVSDSYVNGTWSLGNISEAELLEDIKKTEEVIKSYLSNDFGVHAALKSVLLLVKKTMKMLSDDATVTTGRSPAVIASVKAFVNKFFKSFGFSFVDDAFKNEIPTALEAVIDATVNFRMRVREQAHAFDEQNKKQILKLCDETRDNLKMIGVTINDLSLSNAYWLFKSNKSNNGSTLKNIIDVLVWFRAELLKFIPSLPSSYTQKDIWELCRWTKMHMSTLGVNIEDFSDGRSYWSFPKPDSEATSKFELIINNTVQFYFDIRKIALSITDEKSAGKAKEDILALCEKATSDLQSFGVAVNNIDKSNPEWLLEMNNDKGLSIVQNLMDMIMCSRDQLKSLVSSAKNIEMAQKLDNICYKTRKFLISYGFQISDSFDRNNPSTWSGTGNMNKILIKNLMDVLVMFMNELEAAAEPSKDVEISDLLLKIRNSLESDLRKIGVKLVTTDNKMSWSFKDCESLAESAIMK